MSSAGNVTYGAADAVVSRGPSPIIWADCPVVTYQKDPSKGVHVFEDFKNALVGKETASATDFTAGVGRCDGVIPWYMYVESTKLVDGALQADDDGVLKLDLDGTDADVDCIVSGNNVAGSFKTNGIGSPKGFWFEARVKYSTITDADAGSFVGLAAAGEAKDGGGAMAAGGAAMSDIDYIGFARLSGDGDAMTYVYNEATDGTAQSGSAATLVADTWYRLGLKIVDNGDTIRVRFFVDGVDLGDDAAISIGSTNANFPSSTDMAATLSWIAESGVADGDNMQIDWIRVAQDY